MRRGALLLGLLLGLMSLLSACAPTAREPERLELVRVLGVDGRETVTATGVCGGADGEEENDRGTGQGDSLAAALDALVWSGRRELSVTSVTWLVVGPDVDLKELTLEVLREVQLGAAVTVWLAPEGAAGVLDACSDPVSALELLTDRGVQAPTAAEAAAALAEGQPVTLPRLAADAECLRAEGETVWSGR